MRLAQALIAAGFIAGQRLVLVHYARMLTVLEAARPQVTALA
jgi:hypothetical protein